MHSAKNTSLQEKYIPVAAILNMYSKKMHSYHETYNELGIKTNVMDSSDKEQVKDLLSDIVDLCRIHQLSLDFTHKGNNRAARLIPIASCQDKKNFLRQQRKDSWIDNALNYITSNSITSPNDAAELMIKFLATRYEDSFRNIASEYGFDKERVMDPPSTAAMIADSNITTNQKRCYVFLI